MTAVAVKAHTRRRPEKPRAYLDIHESLRDAVIGDILARELAEVLSAFVVEVKRERSA